MDFVYPYTEEQERFRKEVRSWLEENIPEEMKLPIDQDDFSEEMYEFWREKHKELAKKGWLYPTYPKEYGGGGLTGELETIIHEEFRRYRARGPFTADFVLPSLLVWGTEEQKQKFLIPLLTEEKVAWEKFTEPKSGSDLAGYKSKAVQDGDDWILNGSNVFVSGTGDTGPDWLYGPMRTDDDAPRHRNLGFFMIPVPSPGLEILNQTLVSGKEQHFIFLNNVRVPGDHLIGDDHSGWQVTNTALEREHGGSGSIFRKEAPVKNLVSYVQEKAQKRESPAGNPVLQQTAAAAYIEEHVADVFGRRTFWMYMSKSEMSWEGPSTQLHDRESAIRTVSRIRDVMGMYSLLGVREPLAPHGGAQEVHQRGSSALQHAAGSLNIAKVVLARRIGISRTRERAAPTPMTASQSS